MKLAALWVGMGLLGLVAADTAGAAKPAASRDMTVGDDLADVLRSEAETSRRIRLARSLGLLITDPTSFGTPILITPRQPWMSRGANLTFQSEFYGKVDLTYRSAALTPHGSLNMPPNPAMSRLPGVVPGRNVVNINDIPVGPNEWLLVECFVSGADSYKISVGFDTYPDGRHKGGEASETAVMSPEGRAAASFRPGKSRTRWIEIEGNARRESPRDPKTWQFGGCLITPVRG